MGEEIYFHLIFLSSYSPTPPCYSRTLYVQISTKIIDRVPINSKYQNLSYSETFFFLIFEPTKFVTPHTWHGTRMPLALLILHRKFLATTSKSEYNDKNQVHWLIGSKKISLRKARTHTHLDFLLVNHLATSAKRMPSCYFFLLISNVSFKYMFVFWTDEDFSIQSNSWRLVQDVNEIGQLLVIITVFCLHWRRRMNSFEFGSEL